MASETKPIWSQEWVPGLLVFRVPHLITAEQHANLREMLAKQLPEGRPFVLLPSHLDVCWLEPGMQVNVDCSREDFRGRWLSDEVRPSFWSRVRNGFFGKG